MVFCFVEIASSSLVDTCDVFIHTFQDFFTGTGMPSSATELKDIGTVKPVYNDHLMVYFSAFWSSSRWPRAT